MAALDVGATHTTGRDRETITEVVNLVTAKLWPELGDLLDGES